MGEVKLFVMHIMKAFQSVTFKKFLNIFLVGSELFQTASQTRQQIPGYQITGYLHFQQGKWESS
jgi:hypothetical protein